MIETRSAEKPELEMAENAGLKHESPETTHNQTFDISPEALGTNLPPNYYYSPRFVGTVIVSHPVKAVADAKC